MFVVISPVVCLEVLNVDDSGVKSLFESAIVKGTLGVKLIVFVGLISTAVASEALALKTELEL